MVALQSCSDGWMQGCGDDGDVALRAALMAGCRNAVMMVMRRCRAALMAGMQGWWRCRAAVMAGCRDAVMVAMWCCSDGGTARLQ